jgi:ADP-glucose pyrophosphorylase
MNHNIYIFDSELLIDNYQEKDQNNTLGKEIMSMYIDRGLMVN